MVVRSADGRQNPQRLNAANIESARRHAMLALPAKSCSCCSKSMAAPSDTVDLYRALTIGDSGQILWQRVETIDEVTRPDRNDWYVDTNGVRKEAAAVDAQSVAVAELASALAKVREEWSEEEFHRFTDRLKTADWAAMTETQREGVWAAAIAAFKQADVRSLISEWRKTTSAHAVPFAELTRERLKESMLPRISATLSQADMDAVNAVGDQAGLFVRDQLGIESEALTARGKEIVARGLRDGLGRETIAADLRAEIPELWKKYGTGYSETVAANAIERSRSISQSASYRDAEVSRFEVVAMEDERMCDVCGYLDGQIITVSNASKIQEEVAEAKNIAELRNANPFVGVKLDAETGRKVLRTDKGVDIARFNDAGRHEPLISGDALATEAGVAWPPFHMRCRCTTIPVI
ncbi:MAG: hypothetical protein PHX83_06970 [Acidobacteriia bacterium]|nr:hypothetical protein [Terriglobia bacterium]